MPPTEEGMRVSKDRPDIYTANYGRIYLYPQGPSNIIFIKNKANDVLEDLPVKGVFYFARGYF
jgi:hypothetical protein